MKTNITENTIKVLTLFRSNHYLKTPSEMGVDEAEGRAKPKLGTATLTQRQQRPERRQQQRVDGVHPDQGSYSYSAGNLPQRRGSPSGMAARPAPPRPSGSPANSE